MNAVFDYAPGTPLATLPEAGRATMARIGPIWGQDVGAHRDQVLAVYSPLLARARKDGVAVTRELAYGPHPRHRLDVFRPESATSAPILVFVHGGAFVRGDKTVNAEIYDNVLWWFARQGMVGVNIEYRLAPEAQYPGGAEDVGGAVAWMRDHAHEFGGDPQRIFVFGHSAGGTHVASWAFDPNVAAKPGPETAGVLIVSGRVRADVLPENPNAGPVRAYFGADESRYGERSPVTYAERWARPLFIAVAEFENPLLDVYGAEMFHRVAAARKRAPPFVRMARHNHISMVAHFNSGEDILGRQMLDFMADAAG